MDKTSFDLIARSFSQTKSRRTLIIGLVAAALAGPLSRGGAIAAAGCVKLGQRCKRGSQCCSGVCKKGKCRVHDAGTCPRDTDFCAVGPVGCNGGGCSCAVTTGGAPFCAGKTVAGTTCERDADCTDQFGAGAACAVGCNGEANFCLSRCPTAAR